MLGKREEVPPLTTALYPEGETLSNGTQKTFYISLAKQTSLT